MNSVSIILPSYKRGAVISNTLRSIREQTRGKDVEIVIVEDDYDGGATEAAAQEWDAKYVLHTRTEEWPLFQNLSLIRNLGIKASSGDILIMQDAEVMHEGETVRILVDAVKDNPLSTAFGRVRRGNGEWIDAIVGMRPLAIHRSLMDSVGGYEEQLWGYGCDDHLFYAMLSLRPEVSGVKTNAMSLHQQQPSVPYEEFTALANSAISEVLIRGVRYFGLLPISNCYYVKSHFDLTDEIKNDVVLRSDKSALNVAQIVEEIESFTNLIVRSFGAVKQSSAPTWPKRLERCREIYRALIECNVKLLRKHLEGQELSFL